MSSVEPADQSAKKAIDRWGGSEGSGLFELHDGISAVVLKSGPGELEAPASDAHIVSCFLQTEQRHRHWRDGKPIDDGPLPRGAINIIPAGTKPRAVVSEEVVALQIFVPHKALIRKVEGAYSSSVALHFEVLDPRFQRDAEFETIAGLIADHISGTRVAGSLWLDSLGAAVAARIIDRWSTAAETAERIKTRHQGGLTPRQCRRVVQYMVDHIGEKISLQDLADEARLSVFHFSRTFKHTFGQSPYAYLQKMRINEARRLLEAGDHGIDGLAKRFGFEEASYFSRAFRKEFGLTPSQLIRHKSP